MAQLDQPKGLTYGMMVASGIDGAYSLLLQKKDNRDWQYWARDDFWGKKGRICGQPYQMVTSHNNDVKVYGQCMTSPTMYW